MVEWKLMWFCEPATPKCYKANIVQNSWIVHLSFAAVTSCLLKTSTNLFRKYIKIIKSVYKPAGSSGRGLSPVSVAWSDWENFYSPWIGCWSIAGLPHSIYFAGTHLYTWEERGTVRIKCRAQEHNTVSPVRARTQTSRSRGKRTNQEGTLPWMLRAKCSFLLLTT